MRQRILLTSGGNQRKWIICFDNSTDMAKVIGLTGGIGSGKSRVAEAFTALGVPCYIADNEAKNIMVENAEVKKKITALFGEKAYVNTALNRAFISGVVFNDPDKLAALNGIVHPAVGQHFSHWLSLQTYPYVIKEVAILFETGGQAYVDKSLLITAPKELRIQRVMERDGCSKEDILARMANQWEDAERITLADFVLHNDDWSTTAQKIQMLHSRFLAL